ncbi:MAG: ribonuclease T [Hyphomicrobiales bacterium]|nr:ribonuclease T [Hyphomicrobiales bacterium]
MMKVLVRAVCAAALTLSPGALLAQVAMSGSLTATQACPAYQSIRKQTNPGDVMLQPGRAYQITGKNKDEATHYQILIDGAEPAQRWVAIGCGQTGTAAVAPSTGAGAAGAGMARAGGVAATHVLALGWEPAFCKQHMDKAECARETAQSFDATHLSLHGLWPQPRGKFYCNVDPALVQADKRHDWASLPEPQLSPATRERLAAAMPGFQSGLQRHEWVVHGTCYGAPADVYFNRAAQLAEQVNASKVQQLFAQNIGKGLSSDAIRAAFDEAFGPGAGARVTVNCQGRGMGRKIAELDIFIAGDVNGSAPIGDLIRAATPAPQGCPAGLVDQPLR